MRRAFLALALCASLGACATAQVDSGKSLAAAQDAVAAGVAGVHHAYVSGFISKVNVQAADKLADQADDASKAARAAYASGDLSTAQGAIITLSTLAAEIVALEKPAK